MTSWIDPILRALDQRAAPLDLFIRNDDAGRDDTRLFRLLDVFAEYEWPIDLAAIPLETGPQLADALLARIDDGASIGLHQHGFAHANHEPIGRPCEFGPARPRDVQREDIACGRRLLLSMFGIHLDPIFTPPWNRCTEDTAECLIACGFLSLSRDGTARSFGMNGLLEQPIQIDWFGKAKGVRLTRDEWATRFAQAIAQTSEPLGLMLHHAPMQQQDFVEIQSMLRAVSRCSFVRGVLMRDAIGAQAGGAS